MPTPKSLLELGNEFGRAQVPDLLLSSLATKVFPDAAIPVSRVGTMVFVNERTYLNAIESGRVEDFHRRYEAAVEKVRDEFGRDHPIWIDGEEVRSRGGTFEDRSPCDRRVLLGRFQKGTRSDVKKAVQSARYAFVDWARTDYKDRVKIFLSAADLVSEDKYYLAALMSHEIGRAHV